MFILILALVLLLPVACISLALKSSFSSEELLEMGVYLEDYETAPIAPVEPVNRSQNGSSCLRTSLST